jgi:hypothetical protein
MLFHMTRKKRLGYALISTGSGIIGSWLIWRHWQKKQRKCFDERINQVSEGVIFPEWLSEDSDEVQWTTNKQESNKAPTSVLSHSYITMHSSDTCAPNHWHATYWLRFVALVEQEPILAIVQHTETKRYHVMTQLSVEDTLSCDDCCSEPEVFRLPVQDHYAYFIFVPHQDLDGFTTVEHAQKAAQTLPIPEDILRLLPTSKTTIPLWEE